MTQVSLTLHCFLCAYYKRNHIKVLAFPHSMYFMLWKTMLVKRGWVPGLSHTLGEKWHTGFQQHSEKCLWEINIPVLSDPPAGRIVGGLSQVMHDWHRQLYLRTQRHPSCPLQKMRCHILTSREAQSVSSSRSIAREGRTLWCLKPHLPKKGCQPMP